MTHRFFGTLAAIGLFLAGCGGGDTKGETSSTTSGSGGAGGAGGGGTGGTLPVFPYPRDAVLRMNQLQAKGTHNSYHQPKPDVQAIAALNYTHVPLGDQLELQGVRQFELDTHKSLKTGALEVYHLSSIDEGTSCRAFKDCLKAIKTWSDAHLAHHPIFIQIEPKDSPADATLAEEYFTLMEGEVLDVFPRNRVITPDDVRKGSATLLAGIGEHGWPTLGEARGRVVFFIDNSTALRGFYTHGGKDLEGRLMFIDADPTDAFAGILLANDPIAQAQRITDALAAGLIVRTRADADNIEPFAGDTAKREAALASGAQLVSTDYPEAVVGVPEAGDPYVVEIPGGAPSRCNPVTAPADCASTDIEDAMFFE